MIRAKKTGGLAPNLPPTRTPFSPALAAVLIFGAALGTGCQTSSIASSRGRMGETFVVLPDGRAKPVNNPGSMKMTQTNGVPVVRVEAFRE